MNLSAGIINHELSFGFSLGSLLYMHRHMKSFETAVTSIFIHSQHLLYQYYNIGTFWFYIIVQKIWWKPEYFIVIPFYQLDQPVGIEC